MALLDQLRERVSQVSEKVKETTDTMITEGKNSVETSRKKKELQNLQQQINDLYRVIGAKFLEEHEELWQEESIYTTEIETMKEIFSRQLELQKSIDTDGQEIRRCHHCNEVILKNQPYCVSCGKAVELF